MTNDKNIGVVYDYDDYMPYESVGEQMSLILWISFGVLITVGLLLRFAL